MRFALIGAVAVVAAAFATPVLAQANDGAHRGWQQSSAQHEAYRYHGGPKSSQ